MRKIYLIIILSLPLFTGIHLNAQNCYQRASPLGDAMFVDSNLVVILSHDFDLVNFVVGPRVKPAFLRVTKNMLYGAPVDSIPGHINLLTQQLINERLYLPTEELKELFLRRLAVLIFFDFKNINSLDGRLMQSVQELEQDEDGKIALQAGVVERLYNFYME